MGQQRGAGAGRAYWFRLCRGSRPGCHGPLHHRCRPVVMRLGLWRGVSIRARIAALPGVARRPADGGRGGVAHLHDGLALRGGVRLASEWWCWPVLGSVEYCCTGRTAPRPFSEFDKIVDSIQGTDPDAPSAAQYFGGAGREYTERYGIAPGDVRADLGQGPPACGTQPVRGVP